MSRIAEAADVNVCTVSLWFRGLEPVSDPRKAPLIEKLVKEQVAQIIAEEQAAETREITESAETRSPLEVVARCA
jgi:hypothetical protein